MFGRIEFDYNKTIELANKLDGIADRLDRLKNNQLNNANESVKGSWKGESANSFNRKYADMPNTVGMTGNTVRQTANNVRTIANAFKKAEEDNVAIASGGGGGGSW